MVDSLGEISPYYDLWDNVFESQLNCMLLLVIGLHSETFHVSLFISLHQFYYFHKLYWITLKKLGGMTLSKHLITIVKACEKICVSFIPSFIMSEVLPLISEPIEKISNFRVLSFGFTLYFDGLIIPFVLWWCLLLSVFFMMCQLWTLSLMSSVGICISSVNIIDAPCWPRLILMSQLSVYHLFFADPGNQHHVSSVDITDVPSWFRLKALQTDFFFLYDFHCTNTVSDSELRLSDCRFHECWLCQFHPGPHFTWDFQWNLPTSMWNSADDQSGCSSIPIPTDICPILLSYLSLITPGPLFNQLLKMSLTLRLALISSLACAQQSSQIKSVLFLSGFWGKIPQ